MPINSRLKGKIVVTRKFVCNKYLGRVCDRSCYET